MKPTKSTGKKKTVSQASTAIKPTKDLPNEPPSPPNEPSSSTEENPPSDLPDPFTDSDVVILSSPRKPHKVEYIVKVWYDSRKISGFTRIYDINDLADKSTWTSFEQDIENIIKGYKKQHPRGRAYYRGK